MVAAMNTHEANTSEAINYLELPARDLDKTRQFFEQVFNWQFTD